MGETSPSEGLVFPAMRSGRWYNGRGAIFPVESCVMQTKQTQIPAKPRMVYYSNAASLSILEGKKEKKTQPSPFPLLPPIFPVSMLLKRGPK